ncbi:hypothetical protein [Cupriavidus alkaliphilus]
MPVPSALPLGLTEEFSTDPSRQALWQAFLKKNALTWEALPDTVAALRTVLEPILIRACAIAGQQA